MRGFYPESRKRSSKSINLNRETRSATSPILVFVEVWRQPSIWVNLGQAVEAWTLSIRTGPRFKTPWVSQAARTGANPWSVAGYTLPALMSNARHRSGKPIVGEDWIFQKIAGSLDSRPLAGAGGLRLALGDDAAIWKPRQGYEALLSCDWFLEGMHFLRDTHPPDVVGWKCLTRALSDVAAMGGEPRCYLFSLALPETHAGAWLKKLLLGLRKASQRFHCAAAGGDTTRNETILINVTVVGETERGHALLRSGAKPGDLVFVSGRLGEAELGLRELLKGKNALRGKTGALRKHLYPEPRLRLGRWLAENGLATAAMDLSDGLSSDLPRLCAASGVGAVIEEESLPLARIPQGANWHRAELLKAALDGGDDYELLFTVPARKAKRLPRRAAGTEITRIGLVTATREIALLRESGATETILPRGWDPFRRN